MEDEILNIDLRGDQIPSTLSDFTEISIFALTFDGYGRIKDIGSFANKISNEYDKDQTNITKLSLTELRACLFYEQRRSHHAGDEPGRLTREYINSLLKEIVIRVEDRETD